MNNIPKPLQVRDVTTYTDAELALICYNEKPFYHAVRATGGNINLLNDLVDGHFNYTQQQLKYLVAVVREDLKEHPLDAKQRPAGFVYAKLAP